MNDTAKHRRRRNRTALGVVAVLAATALWARQSARNAERRFPPEGRFVDVDGVRVHYLELGAGPPVVLLHGNGVTSADFLACGLAQALAHKHRVVAFDRPGFGYTGRPRQGLWPAERQAELLAGACRLLGIDNPVVLGHSWGTQVALAMALGGAVPLRGLVLVSGYYFPSFRPDALLLAAPRLPVVGDVMRYTVSAILARVMLPGMLRLMFHPQPVVREFLETVHAPLMLRPWQLRAAAETVWIMARNAERLSANYHHINVPAEIFAGVEDRVVDQADQAARLDELLPDSHLHFVPDEGHMLHYTRQTAIEEAVERLVRGEAPLVVAAQDSSAD